MATFSYTTFKQITLERAMYLIADLKVNNVYFLKNKTLSCSGSLECAADYKMDMNKLHKQKWFEMEVLVETSEEDKEGLK